MMRAPRLVAWLYFLLLAVVLPAPASAAAITLTGTGSVIGIDDPAGILDGWGFAMGQTVTFATQFDPTGLSDGSLNDPNFGSYATATPQSLSVSVNGYTFEWSNTQLQVLNSPGDDYLALRGFGTTSASVLPPDIGLNELGLVFEDLSGAALSSDAAVFPPPPLLSTMGGNIFLFSPVNGGTAFITFRIDSVTAVPEPATLSLLGLGLAGVVARRFRRKRT